MTPRRWVAALALAASILLSAAAACTGEGASPGIRQSDGGDSSASPDASDPEAAIPDASLDTSPDAGVDASPDVGFEASFPSLVALAVSGAPGADASFPVALSPAFSPDIHDYTVRCAAGTNVLTVSMTASDGSASLLVQPIPSASLPQQTLSLNVAEGQAVVAAATNGDATVEYWVRCLPHDFPSLQWTPHPEAGTPTPGYYMVGTDDPTTSGCYAMVLDGNGVPVWYSPAQSALGWCIFDVDSVVPGTISFDSVVDYPAEFEIHQLSPPVTTKIVPAGLLNVDLHELLLLANGDYLVISSPLQSGVNVTGMKVLKLDGTYETLTANQPIMACNLVEFAPDGTVVWTWTATDHFDVLADSIIPQLLPYGPNASLVVDPIHCNSIDVDPTSGNLLVSARQMNSIFSIERSTGKVLWKMGGAHPSKDGATYIDVADPFVQQHDARFQPDWSSSCNGGSGHISLFDDQTYETLAARAVVYDVVVGNVDAGTTGDGGCGDAGTGAGEATVSWQRTGAGPSLAMGSFRILPDGTRIIGWGDIAGAGFTEVDVGGNDLADLTFPDGNTTYRALKVPLSALDLGALRSSAGLP